MQCSIKNEPPHDKTNKMTVRPAKTQISLDIHPVWSESSLCAQWVAKDTSFLHADSEDSDQTGRTTRLIWVFTGCTCHFVGFVTRQLKCFACDDVCLCTINTEISLSSIKKKMFKWLNCLKNYLLLGWMALQDCFTHFKPIQSSWWELVERFQRETSWLSTSRTWRLFPHEVHVWLKPTHLWLL